MSDGPKRRPERPKKPPGSRKRPRRRAAPPPPGTEASAEARRVATVVLEVLAGAVGPTEAAAQIGITPNSYYKLESRALEGLIEGCEPRPRGRVKSVDAELAEARVANERLERECARLKALVRALGRTAGVKSPRKKSAKAAKAIEAEGKARGKAGRRRKRKPTIRALRRAAELKQNPEQSSVEGTTPEEEGSHDRSDKS